MVRNPMALGSAVLAAGLTGTTQAQAVFLASDAAPTACTKGALTSDANLSNLRQLLDAARRFLTRNLTHLQSLEESLKRTEVVACDQVPRDVITIHTQVRIHELDIGRHSVYTLVFPGEADVARERISVLSPIGSALLGQRVGDLIECRASGVTKRLKVKEIVYQPEAIRTAA